MTREEYSRTLSYMERLRLDSYEAETKFEARSMIRQYEQLAKEIEPYVLGTKAFDPSPAFAPADRGGA